MYRIALCLMIVLASATVAAREVKLSAANDGSCPEAATEKSPHRALNRGTAAPLREGKTSKPSVHSDVGNPRSANRWNSFLPGMFR